MNYKYHIDTKVYRIEPYENYVRITGWGFDVNNQNVSFAVKMNGENVEYEMKSIKRLDVEKKYSRKCNVPVKSGFNIKACWPKDSEELEKLEECKKSVSDINF